MNRQEVDSAKTISKVRYPTFEIRPVLLVILLIATFLRLFQLPTLPPGLNFDEAGNGVAALDILNGAPKLWWQIGGGKEPLWPYVTAASTIIVGNVPLALRLPAALIGILTAAAVYPLVLRLFGGAGRRSRRAARLTALLTVLALALSGWHLHFSRLGFRAILLPLLSALAFYFFWRRVDKYQPHLLGAHRYLSPTDIVLSSLFTALAIAAYLAGRLLPLIPLLFFAGQWVVVSIKGRSARRRLNTELNRASFFLIPYFVIILLLLTPLIIYFMFNPIDFVARLGTVSIFNPEWNQGDLIGTLWRTLILTFGTFAGFSGDANPLVNLPYQPALPIYLVPFFVIGFVTSLFRSLVPQAPSPSHATERRLPNSGRGSPRTLSIPKGHDVSQPSLSPHLFLICWWVVMLLPALLAPEGAPHHLRLLGTLVPTYVFVALGFVKTINYLIEITTRFSFGSSRAAYLLPAGCFLFLAVQTYLNYFVRWPGSVDFTLPFDLYAVHLADEMAHTPPDAHYVLPMDIRAGREARHYTLDYLVGANNPLPYTYLPVDEHNAETLLSHAAVGKDKLYVVRWTEDKHREADAKEIVTYLLDTGATRLGRDSFRAYDLERYGLSQYASSNFSANSPAIFSLPPLTHSITATFEDEVRLDAAFVPAVTYPGDWLPVAIAVTPLGPMDTDYKASIRLLSPDGGRLAQKDRTLLHNFHQGTSRWPAETVNEYYLLPVPPNTPAGNYAVVVVIYRPDTLAPLAAGGRVEVPLGQVKVQ